jgi:16S rRNA (guanine527-N7)-methyltransferase
MPNQPCFSQPSERLWQDLKWKPSDQQLQQLLSLQKLLVEWNEHLNLTRLTEGEDYWIAQVFDSLWPLQEELQTALQSRRCIDIGTGCGFPGLAVAIALPGAELTLVDSVNKKTNAVAAIAGELGLNNRVTVRTERVERTGQDQSCRGQYDLAMARAVAHAPVVAEYLIPLLKPAGEALLFRGQWNSEDQKGLAKALIPLQARLAKVERLELPANRGVRHQLRLKPNRPCPAKYPRAVGLPSKMPLG